MKVKLYVSQGQSPDDIANQAKGLIEEATGQQCFVRVVGQYPGKRLHETFKSDEAT